MAFSHVLVPVDFSEPSLHAVRLAVKMARNGAAKITFAHVILPHVSALAADAPGWAAFDPDLVVRYQQELENEARHALERVKKEEVPTDVSVDVVVVTGPIADRLNDLVAERGADLICVGTTGRTGLAHLFLGSVAERVVATAKVPVLVTH